MIDDDGGPEIVAAEVFSEAAAPQALWVRVGPVFLDGVKQSRPGVWVSYQERHMGGPLSGPVLLTPGQWDELVKAVQTRLNGWQG